MEIIGDVKNYEWGKLGSSSIVAELAALNDTAFNISSSTSYSELWMGTHSSGPSIVKSTGEQLSKKLSDQLPFLFKVLSIRKALSIQVHPNKTEAERLHREHPDIYKDPNHKPELAIALTEFQALCGFRRYSEIYSFCLQLPPLKELLGGDESINGLNEGSTAKLRQVYEKLMTSEESEIKKCIECITANYQKVLASNGLLEIFCTINTDFPNDVGVLSLFFLNLIKLNPGEAIFLGANEIHAYISGDCIECMACSDNVVRAGLTSKKKDVRQLINCLNYAGLPSEEKLFEPKRLDAYSRVFKPPVEDFAVVEVVLPITEDSYQLKVHKADSILLVLQGEKDLNIPGCVSITIKRGSIVYIPSNALPVLNNVPNSNNDGKDFIAYMAMKNHFLN